MIVKKIEYTNYFIRCLAKLPADVQKTAWRKEELFRINPLHPSLRLHELHGRYIGVWSISVTNKYRIIFERQADGGILFMSIGTHDLYKHL